MRGNVISNNMAFLPESDLLRNSKWCLVSSLTKRLAKILIRLCVCAGWFEPLLVAHSMLEISCCGSNIVPFPPFTILVLCGSCWCRCDTFLCADISWASVRIRIKFAWMGMMKTWLGFGVLALIPKVTAELIGSNLNVCKKMLWVLRPPDRLRN